jgi:hypothetical protein
VLAVRAMKGFPALLRPQDKWKNWRMYEYVTKVRRQRSAATQPSTPLAVGLAATLRGLAPQGSQPHPNRSSTAPNRPNRPDAPPTAPNRRAHRQELPALLASSPFADKLDASTASISGRVGLKPSSGSQR